MSVKQTKTKTGRSLQKSRQTFPVVGVGASAGGLDAFKKLLKSIPEDSGAAYVLVQHLDPKHDSVLPELLQKVTKIPVLQIFDDQGIQPNHIYIIPSNKMLVANDGVLQLSPRPSTSKSAKNLPIDLFFKSIAEVHQSQSIGIVLSGNASDGTLGLKAIKDQGGITFAQDSQSASYPEMPENAVKAHVVDFVLPPEKIAGKLIELIRNVEASVSRIKLKIATGLINEILSLLKKRKGTDFTYYKRTTIERRILRRMALNKIKDASKYLKYLKDNEPEQDQLYQDLLIPVTGFFRDENVFAVLSRNVLPTISKTKQSGESLRIWVAGCSTGEEAYSLAMCLNELKGKRAYKVQIFATDISEPAIAKARAGVYSKKALEGVSPKRMRNFFQKAKGGYQVNKDVREMCLFAVHDFLKDPPFGKLDLVSCRNVLIYMEPYLQRKALTTFHYALNPEGLLMLGKSESGTQVSDLFGIAKRNEKIFLRKDIQKKHVPVPSGSVVKSGRTKRSQKDTNPGTDFQKIAHEIIFNKHTPSGIIVNDSMDIVHFHGNNSVWLQVSTGKPSHNLTKLAKPGLAFELRNLLHKARKQKKAITKSGIPLTTNGAKYLVTFEAIPLPNIVDPYYLILFHIFTEEENGPRGKMTGSKSGSNRFDKRNKQLEEELRQTREDMSAITEAQEAANDDLQSANEELQSSGEELQSLNEELETSKEEVQSTNEELVALNQELSSLNEHLIEERDYAEGIISTVRESLIILDGNLVVKSANRSFYNTFKVNEKETEGKSIFDLGNKQWNIPSLRKLFEVMQSKRGSIVDYDVDYDFPSIGHRSMMLNAREIARDGGKEKLILLAIEDVTEVRLASEKIKRSESDLRELASGLEKTVSLRTMELKQANESLRQNNTELSRVNKELESFAYISSHDLQEPLRKIQIFTSRILKQDLDNLSESGKNYFTRITDAASRMQSLIRDLLTYSRSTANSSDKFELTDINKILHEVLDDLREQIIESKGSVELSKLPEARVIPFQFKQVMSNLISNSLKFVVAGRDPRIAIKGEVINSKDLLKKIAGTESVFIIPGVNYHHISVSDNGIGFEPEFNRQIFDVFRRLNVDSFAGTGIGLAIVKRIVENHKGIVTATSELNKGSMFDIYIPESPQGDGVNA